MQGSGDEIIRRLRQLGWTQADLARILDRTPTCISELIMGKRNITPEMATLLGVALGDDAAFWLERDARYRAEVEPIANMDQVRERVQIFRLAPVRDMQRRGWITSETDLEHIASDLRAFFKVESLQDDIGFPLATRRSRSLETLNTSQRAWCFRARNIAEKLPVTRFETISIGTIQKELRALASHPQESCRVSEVLNAFGVRFVIVEPLQASPIDGAAFWLDDDSPVIALSLRYDRMDYFWHTLMHECAHVQYHDAISVDTNLVGDGQSPPLLQDEIERRADMTAAKTLVAEDEIDSFIRRVGPMYSKPKILGFSRRINIHPAIVVGQLQHRGEVGWNAHREMLAKVRSIVIKTSVVDGWGQTLPPGLV